MVDGFTRGRTFNIILLANAHLQRRELDEACAAGDQALGLAVGLNSARTIRYTRDLRRRMTAFASQPVIGEFQERAHELLPGSDPRPLRNSRTA